MCRKCNTMYQKYIEELKNGKQIRITYNQQNQDFWTNGWWSEELWCYDNKLKLFKCFYPISSYQSNYHTTHKQKEIEVLFRELFIDCENINESTIEKVNIEEQNVLSGSLTIKELAIEKIKTMSDDEIKRILSL